MLSQTTIDIVKSSIPVLAERGTEITKHFYRRMFASHPELLNLFNRTNQELGRQQTALADSLYKAAQYIDQLEKIRPAVKQICHKHASLGVKKEHYSIIGQNLLAAMKEVLGEAASDEFIHAWTEAYWAIANLLIEMEEELYKQAENQPGGWRYFKSFVVSEKVKESSVITSFYLKPKDGGPVPSYLPGQYITVRVKLPGDTYWSNRQYSLSDAPGKGYFRISVKREAELDKPRGNVSNYLHDHIQGGDEIDISPPAGDFVLHAEESTPVVLISGGVGITPMMSMLNTIAAEKPERTVTFIHAAKNEEVHAFKYDVEKTIAQLPNACKLFCYDHPRHAENADMIGQITKDVLKDYVNNKADYYVCGPVPFMKAIITYLTELGIPTEKIHYEFFGPAIQFSHSV